MTGSRDLEFPVLAFGVLVMVDIRAVAQSAPETDPHGVVGVWASCAPSATSGV